MRIRELYKDRALWVLAAVILLGAVFLTTGCAGAVSALRQLVQPPRFEHADQPAELRLISPSATRPAGGAGVTVWVRVTNPNPFGFTLSTLDTTLHLEGQQAASGSFPLGLPLGAQQESVIPVDLTVSFADLPALANVLRQSVSGSGVMYQLDGTVGIEAGRLGRQTFGPMPMVRGTL